MGAARKAGRQPVGQGGGEPGFAAASASHQRDARDASAAESLGK